METLRGPSPGSRRARRRGAEDESPGQSAQLTRRALGLAAEGILHPVIGQRFPLDRAADAHATIEARATIGKTLLIANAEGSR